MDLQTQKIEFVQEFLKIQDEEIILNLRNFLNKSLNKTIPMSLENFNQEIDLSLMDSMNNNIISASELKKKFKK